MKTHSATWYDSMYNNRALVPDHAAHFADWSKTSADARAALKCTLNIAYGDGPNESLDIFPASQPNAPVVVFIHGGYWRSLDKADHSFVAPPLHDLGACVVVVNYALCPGTTESPVTIPDIAHQMVKAMAWTWQNIAHHGGNPNNVTVAGHSAGGHLAAMLLACDWKQVDPKHPRTLDSKGIVYFWLVRPHTVAQNTFPSRLTQAHSPARAHGQSGFVATAPKGRFVHGGGW